MADITTHVMVIGTGPAGSATAALLATYGTFSFAGLAMINVLKFGCGHAACWPTSDID